MNRRIWPAVLAGVFMACSNATLPVAEAHLSGLPAETEASPLVVGVGRGESGSGQSEGPRLIVPRQVRLTGVGSTYQLEPQVTGAAAVAYEYVSETERMVKVSPAGEIEITGGGFCTVYVMARLESGFWIFQDVAVSSPSDEQRVFFE